MLPICFAARFIVRSQATKQQRRYERSLRRGRTVKALFDHLARSMDTPNRRTAFRPASHGAQSQKYGEQEMVRLSQKLASRLTTNHLRQNLIEEKEE